MSTDNTKYSTDTQTFGTFRVRVNPVAVPEPGSVALFAGMSLTGAAFLRRSRERSARRRNQASK